MKSAGKTRIKICGITRLSDALSVANYGADALGLVFYEPSPRSVTIEQASAIANQLPPFVSVVGLFVNAEPDYVRAVLSKVHLDLLQFHGDETEAYCQSFARPYLKAIRVKSEIDISRAVTDYPSASGILLDAWHEELPGGTGLQFDWSLVKQAQNTPVILAGGLNSANVTEAIARTKPWAVDVSSGVEIEPGIKSEKLIREFIEAVNQS